MKRITIGQIYTNETRPQKVEVLRVGRNIQKPMDKEVDFTSKVEYKVIKNTLIRKALDTLDADYSSFNNGVLKGFSGIIFSTRYLK